MGWVFGSVDVALVGNSLYVVSPDMMSGSKPDVATEKLM
jgi:hypothetical protein